MHHRVSQGIWGHIALVAVSALFSSLLLDRVLLILGYPSRPPGRYSHPPGLSELRRSIEFAYHFVTNSQGLRYEEIPLAKPTGDRRIFVVGDSFTEGVGVEDADRFTDRLEGYFRQNGPRVSFINGGLGGTAPLEYARVFMNAGLKYDPDGLLVVLFANDVAGMLGTETPKDITSDTTLDMQSDGDRSRWRRVLECLWPRAITQLKLRRQSRQYLNRTQPKDFVGVVTNEAVRRGIPQSQIDRWKASLPEHLVTAVNRGMFNGSLLSGALLYPTLWTDALDIDTPLAEQKWKAMISMVTGMVTAARQRGVQVAVVFVPTRFQYDPNTHSESNVWVRLHGQLRGAWLTGHTEVERRLHSWADDLSVPFLDLTDRFREAATIQEDLNWPLDGHWTPEGHRVASLEMYKWMTTQNVFTFLR